MRRSLVVEGEALAPMTDLDDASREIEHPGGTGGAARLPPAGQDGGRQGVLREQMQRIGQQQLLMLLLVLRPELDKQLDRRRWVRQQTGDRRVHMLAIGGHRAVDGRVSNPRLGLGCRAPTAS